MAAMESQVLSLYKCHTCDHYAHEDDETKQIICWLVVVVFCFRICVCNFLVLFYLFCYHRFIEEKPRPDQLLLFSYSILLW